MTNYTDVVARVKRDLEARGVSLVGPCGAFAITCRVAWALREEGVGLVAKSRGQNACPGPTGQLYAIDAVMLKDGQTFDILVNGGGEEDALGKPIPGTGNGPAWNVTGAQPISAWRTPFQVDVDVPDTPPLPVDPPPVVEPPPPDDGDPVAVALAALRAAEAALAALRLDLKGVQDQVLLLRGEVLTVRLALSKGFHGETVGSVYGRQAITLTPIP